VKNFIERLDTPDDESVTDDEGIFGGSEEGIFGGSEQERSDCFRTGLRPLRLGSRFAPVLNQTTTL
jgi:hypothetical protein